MVFISTYLAKHQTTVEIGIVLTTEAGITAVETN
jgi:hypothetical protein